MKKAARERSTTSWSQLLRQLGSVLLSLHADDQVEVLVGVDAGTPAGEPFLTALLAATDSGALAVYERVAKRLGRDVPDDAKDARAQWQTDVLLLHQLYRYQ
ncbi:hypothetical protein [Streptomyces tibetensis]|uniref:hypothetical protein n=1 Tax=Streptomyces tibetensis TaxID=2382123 RepID=UPI00340E8B66